MGRKRRKNHPNQINDEIQNEEVNEVLNGEETESESGIPEAYEEGYSGDIAAEGFEAADVYAEESNPEEVYSEDLYSREVYGEEQIPEEVYAQEAGPEAEAFDETGLYEVSGEEPQTSETAEPEREDDGYDLSDEEETENTGDRKTSRDESLGSFIGEMGRNCRSWIQKNRSFCIFTVLAVVVCLIVIIIAGMLNKPAPLVPPAVSDNLAGSSTAVVSDSIPLPPDPLAEDAVPEVNDLINRYFAAMQNGDLDTFLSIRSYTDSVEKAKFEAKCEYIESYDNIHCYTKPGPYEASYMVYVTYDLKLKDWDKPAPALVTLVVCTDQENHLYIYSGAFDENIVDYIRGVTSQEDVYALITRVQTEYQSVVDSDAAFAEYMSVLNQLIKDGVGVRLAAAAEEGIQPDDDVSVSESSVSEDVASAEPVSDNAVSENGAGDGDTSFMVRTTATVNVRMSDSENADKLGKAENGLELTCLEQLQNGWSKVLFEGKTGYIKTDYLVAVGTQNDAGEQNTIVGKAIVMSSVNIRGSADMDGNVLGKAYPGTSFDVTAKDWNGWTTILYNGKTAYIRTEYIEFKAN